MAKTERMDGGLKLRSIYWDFCFCSFILLEACHPSGPSGPASDQSRLFERGKAIYQANCTACHNPDPSKAGALGPDIAGSSAELIEARVLHAKYPSRYQPKRQTHMMVSLPQLKSELPALAEYLKRR